MHKIAILIVLPCLLWILSSCTMHKDVLVSYKVINKTGHPIFVDGQSFKVRKTAPARFFHADTTYEIAPSSKEYIVLEWRYCWFGDCKLSIRNASLLDSLSIYKDSVKKVPLAAEDLHIRIKRQQVKIRVDEKQ